MASSHVRPPLFLVFKPEMRACAVTTHAARDLPLLSRAHPLHGPLRTGANRGVSLYSQDFFYFSAWLEAILALCRFAFGHIVQREHIDGRSADSECRIHT